MSSVIAALADEPREPISFVTVVNDFAELKHNLLASPIAGSAFHEWIVIDNTGNRLSDDICKLYCDAQARAAHDLVFFFHQDVYIPGGWERNLFRALAQLEMIDPNWGVLGAVGVLSSDASGPPMRGHWADPHQSERQFFGPLPCPVGSLDELWLGIRKRRGLSFDPELPGFHCYGIDLCLTAASQGLRCYAIDAFVAHKYRDANGAQITRTLASQKILQRSTPQFAAAVKSSKDYVAKKWRARLPFRSTSMAWEKSDYEAQSDR
jgi:hypothetical protein